MELLGERRVESAGTAVAYVGFGWVGGLVWHQYQKHKIQTALTLFFAHLNNPNPEGSPGRHGRPPPSKRLFQSRTAYEDL